MIDDQGRPIVFCHGTDAEFNEFSTSVIGNAQEGKLFAGSGFYFADDQNDASETIATYPFLSPKTNARPLAAGVVTPARSSVL